MIHKNLQIMLIYFIVSLFIVYQPAQSQSSEIYVCVTPSSNGNSEYLIAFKNISQVGLIFPENSDITVYGPEGLRSQLYSFDTDAKSGGYRTTGSIASVTSGSNIPREGDRVPCKQHTEINDASVYPSHILRATQEHMVTIGLSSNTFNSRVVLGVFSFHFPLATPKPIHFQVVQLTPSTIDIRPPVSTENTTYVVIANKSLGVSEDFNGEFTPPQPTITRSILVQQLTNSNLNIFDLMHDGTTRIYPNTGLINTVFVPGHYLRLQDFSPEAPVREFTPGDTVRPIEGTRANYYLLTNLEEPAGALLNSQSSAKVVTTDEQGRLLITNSVVQEAVIEAWLVDVAND